MADKLKSQYIIVIVAALGYFVDIYDLILFGIVRVKSLEGLGVDPSKFQETGVLLLNMQMAGMLVGGIFFGILGDRKGRIKVLFGSILMYSLANIANGLVQDVPTYAAVRFLAGVGLAGELGAGITLVSETMSKETRGYGTMIVVFFGAMGAVAAALIADKFDWRVSYFIGGGLGMMLLLLRVGAMESGMFNKLNEQEGSRGQFMALFKNPNLFKRYLRCILIGLPVWFVVGILIVFSPEFSKALGVDQAVNPGRSVMWAYIGLSLGDLLTGILSQVFKSRKKIVLGALISGVICSAIYLSFTNVSLHYFYFLCFLVGVTQGYWGLFVTIASENFGTNIRATVTTTVPNFVRGATVPITLGFEFFNKTMGLGMVYGAAAIGVICFAIAIYAALQMEETFAKDLDFLEDGV